MIKILVFLAILLTPTLVDAQTPVVVYCDTGTAGANRYVPCNTTNLFPTSAAASAVVLSHAVTTSLGTSLVVKAAAGDLAGFNCTAITGGAAGYCIAYNAASAPSTGALTGAAVLDVCYFDTTARGCSLAHINGTVAYGTGIVILMTSATTPFTYTTGTDTGYISADYE
jgi:hypothetical protein